jgi:hypothetical protein
MAAKATKATRAAEPALPRDNWRDKSTFRCGTCSYFVLKELDVIGRCRRHAPGTAGAGWPVVFLTDFCGDHKLGAAPNPNRA